MRALTLAQKARGHTSPNPLVGAVIVKNGRIIGEGFHKKAGTPHAEVHAIESAQEDISGATMYVTLEPCSHIGKTPPCADLLIAKRIKKVFVALEDPNPLVKGRGISRLREAGIEVEVGLCAKEAELLNEAYLYYIQKKSPFVVGKWAMSLDGKIATKTGESQWITSQHSRMHSHILRATYDAMLVGIGTVLTDNPALTCRLQHIPCDDDKENLIFPHQPACIVLDTLGRTPLDAKIFDCPNRSIYIAVGRNCALERKKALESRGAEVFTLPASDRGLSIVDLLDELGKRNITSILVEGGSAVLASFIEEKVINKLHIYIGDTVIGGKESLPAVGGEGFVELADALRITYDTCEIVDNNIILTAYTKKGEDARVHRNH